MRILSTVFLLAVALPCYGQLVLPYNGTNAADNTSMYITTTGSKDGIVSLIDNATHTRNALYGRSNGQGSAIRAEMTGLGTAGRFEIRNSTGPGNALIGATDGTGRAGLFKIENADNTKEALYVFSNGSGIAVRGYMTGTGVAGHFQVANAGNSEPAVYAKTNGTGHAIRGVQQGSGYAGHFQGDTQEAKGVYVRVADDKNALYVAGGKVQVGAEPVPAGYAMGVDGKLVTTELKVALPQDWADYVFADDYELMPLDQVKRYIDSNGHLPGMPSAADVEAAGGFEVGATQVKLLEKIEELTLHLIAQQEANADLLARIEALEAGR